MHLCPALRPHRAIISTSVRTHPISYAMSPSDETIRHLLLYWGVCAVSRPRAGLKHQHALALPLNVAKANKVVDPSDGNDSSHRRRPQTSPRQGDYTTSTNLYGNGGADPVGVYAGFCRRPPRASRPGAAPHFGEDTCHCDGATTPPEGSLIRFSDQTLRRLFVSESPLWRVQLYPRLPATLSLCAAAGARKNRQYAEKGSQL